MASREMATVTTIEWTEQTWNPVTGCTKVSQGCKHCYAERIADRFWGKRPFTEVRCHPERLEYPKTIRKPTSAAGVAFFFKQWGGVFKKHSGRILDGRTYDEFPVRVVPAAA